MAHRNGPRLATILALAAAIFFVAGCHLLIGHQPSPAASDGSREAALDLPRLSEIASEARVADLAAADLPGAEISLVPGLVQIAAVQSSASLLATGQCVEPASGRAYLGITDGPWGLQVFDTGDPAQPKPLAPLIATGLKPLGLALLGSSTLVVASYDYSAHVIDIAGATPQTKSTVPIGGQPWGVAVYPPFALIVHHGGVTVIDLSSPGSPQKLATTPLPGLPHDGRIVGDQLYVVGQTQLHILKLSGTPLTLTVLGSLDLQKLLPGSMAYEGWTPGGPYLYAVDKLGRRLLTVDVTVPSQMQLVDQTAPGTGDYHTIDGKGSRLYVGVDGSAAASGGVRVYDLSKTPAAPSFVSQANIPSKVYEVRVFGAHLYAACGDSMLRVFTLP